MSSPGVRRPSVLFYCQHAYGVGHLMRGFALAAELAHELRVVMVCGGRMVPEIPLPDGVDLIRLPPIGYTDEGRLVSLDEEVALGTAWRRRRETLLRLLRDLRPEILLIEYFPFGRRDFRSEILPMLETARHVFGSLVLCSLRDIQQTGKPDQAEFDERAGEMARRFFDGVLVHADPRLARLEETFTPRTGLGVPVHYTGMVDAHDSGALGGPAREPIVVVSAGGGRGGWSLLRTAVRAFRDPAFPRDLRMRVIAGAQLQEELWLELSAEARETEGLEVVRWVPDLARELSRAEVSVSRCGYNTAVDLLHAGTPALVVPYATPTEDEQTNRARRLEALGVVRVLPEEQLDPSRLAAEIRETREFQPADPALDMDGARRSAQLIAGWLRQRGALS